MYFKFPNSLVENQCGLDASKAIINLVEVFSGSKFKWLIFFNEMFIMMNFTDTIHGVCQRSDYDPKSKFCQDVTEPESTTSSSGAKENSKSKYSAKYEDTLINRYIKAIEHSDDRLMIEDWNVHIY